MLQQVLFHSSCSQQLYLLDIFGSFQLIEFESTTFGVIGFGINPTINFEITLDTAQAADNPNILVEFLSVVVLSAEPGLLPPQIYNVEYNPPESISTLNQPIEVVLIPGQPFNVISTIGGTLDGVGCFDVSNSTIQCDATLEPTTGEDGADGGGANGGNNKNSNKKNARFLENVGNRKVKGTHSQRVFL